MLAGRDSSSAPSDAQLDAFYAQGVRVFGGYIKLGNDGLYNGWSQADFARVKAHGFIPVAYMSGWDDPAQARAVATSWGVGIVLVDIESGIRPDGSWAQGWLNTAQAGEYGNLPVQYHTAAIHEDAGYFGYDPGATWPAGVARPAGICGWQWRGSHLENGLTVDSAWWDDGIAQTFGGSAQKLTGGDDMNATDAKAVLIAAAHGVGRGSVVTQADVDASAARYVAGTAALDTLVAEVVSTPDAIAYENAVKALIAAGPAQPDNDPAPIPGPAGPPGAQGATGPEGPAADTTAVQQSIVSKIIAALKAAFGL